MAIPLDLPSLALGAALGAGAIWLAFRGRGSAASTLAHSELERERAALSDHLAAEFRRLSAEALGTNNRQFLDLATTQFQGFQNTARNDIDQIVKPVKESLDKVENQIRTIENQRHQSFGELRTLLANLGEDQGRLRTETRNLVTALRNPGVRGRWGEEQLQRVVEFAGMIERVHFETQPHVVTDDGAQRPDMTILLPGGRKIVVDSKVPLDAYLHYCADENGPELRQLALEQHARQVRTHMAQLGAKAYWRQFDDAPDFVVMFLFDEGSFSAALRLDPTLIEAGVAQNVIPATPTTLIALLKAVQFGWRQEALAANAREISTLGSELYDRLAVFAGHFSSVGKKLNQAVESYNQTAASLEKRVLVSGRKFRELGAMSGAREIEEPPQIEHNARAIEGEIEVHHPSKKLDAE